MRASSFSNCGEMLSAIDALPVSQFCESWCVFTRSGQDRIGYRQYALRGRRRTQDYRRGQCPPLQHAMLARPIGNAPPTQLTFLSSRSSAFGKTKVPPFAVLCSCGKALTVPPAQPARGALPTLSQSLPFCFER